MKINWKVRMQSKVFWVSLVPIVLVLVQQICGLFNVKIEVTGLSNQLLDIINSLFVILGLVGIVTDPTTQCLSDSERVLNKDGGNE